MNDHRAPGPELSRPAPGGVRAAQRARVRANLLDAAEEVFAEKGYAGAGVRDITDHAGARLAAVSDQFGGKEQLLHAVLTRRIEELSTDRRLRFAAVPTSGSRMRRLRALIQAFTEPMLERAGQDKGWRYYFRFTAQLANSADPVQLLVADRYNASAGEMIDQLRRIYPGTSESRLAEAYQLLLAPTLQLFADNLRLDSLTRGRIQTRRLAERHAALVTFLEGGIERLCSSGDPD